MSTPTKFFKPKVDKYIQLYSKYAEKEAKTLETSGYVSSVNITNTGFSYDDGISNFVDSQGNPVPEYPPTITFSAPQNGRDRATGTAIINSGSLVGIDITNRGSGYTSPPTITITTQTLDQSNGDILVGEAISYVYPTDSNGDFAASGTGSGYSMSNPSTITIDAPTGGGTRAQAVVYDIVDGKITTLAVINGGTGYTTSSIPNDSISGGDGSGGTFKVLYNLGFGATATSVLGFVPDIINNFTWRLESPIGSLA